MTCLLDFSQGTEVPDDGRTGPRGPEPYYPDRPTSESGETGWSRRDRRRYKVDTGRVVLLPVKGPRSTLRVPTHWDPPTVSVGPGVGRVGISPQPRRILSDRSEIPQSFLVTGPSVLGSRSGRRRGKREGKPGVERTDSLPLPCSTRDSTTGLGHYLKTYLRFLLSSVFT